MKRRRVTNKKKWKVRIKKDRSARKNLYEPISILPVVNKLKRETFKLPNGYKIEWLRKEVLRMQFDLAVVIRKRKISCVVRLINQILRNKYVQYWAVYKSIVAKDAKLNGSFNNKIPSTQFEYDQIRNKLWEIIKKPYLYKSSPLNKIWIPKQNSEKYTAISVPSYVDKALQYLYLIVLDVFQEEFSEKDSYGFRAFRSPGWAAKAITLHCWSRKNYEPPKFAVELDIRKYFDTVNHEYIINNIARLKMEGEMLQIIPKNIIRNWLDSGYIDIKENITPKNQAIPTNSVIPKGGPIGPIIANMVLNGLQTLVESYTTNNLKSAREPGIWVKTDDIIAWRYEGRVILTTTNVNNQNYNKIVKKLENKGFKVPNDMIKNFLTGTCPFLKSPWSYKLLTKNSIFSKRTDIIDNSSFHLFRYADDCLILLNDENAIDSILNRINEFLKIRGMLLNFKETHVRRLHCGEKFRFVGFEFSMLRKHGIWKVYNYPPLSKIKKLKERVNMLFNKYKYKPHLAYYKINAVLRNWCNFYACGNSKNTFGNITFWLWKRTWLFWWKFFKYRKKYRIKSQRQKKKLLGYDIIKNCLRKLNTYDSNSQVKWWIVPKELNPNTRWIDEGSPYFLINPRHVKLSTTSIIAGLNAYHPDDRLILKEKAIYWENRKV